MQMIVRDISEHDGLTIVTAENELGKFRGIWRYREAPVRDGTYSVELTFCGGKALDGSRVTVTEAEGAEISCEGGLNTFTAECEDIDDIYYLRFAPDALEMLDIENAPDIRQGDFIRFSLPYEMVGIYPY